MNRAHYVIYTTPKVCVDKIQSPATRKVYVDQIRRTELKGTKTAAQLLSRSHVSSLVDRTSAALS